MNKIWKSWFIITIILVIVSLASCEVDEPVTQAGSADIKLVIPPGFPNPVYSFDLNPLSQKGFELGRKLFYDPVLSKDNSISCGSCHQQFAAFSHLEHKVSHGIYGLLGKRNAPGIFNLIWYKEFMWDGGVHNLEIQPFSPITNPVEMDETLPGVISKLQTNQVYPALFKGAFGTDSITSQLIFRALVQFMGLMISADSKYDQFTRGEAVLSQAEKNGHDLFMQKCDRCHRPPLFSDLSYRNNGLDIVFADSGRAKITLDTADIGKFRVPSLRNIELTAPYMHDGRFSKLTEVLDHYHSGIQFSATLDTTLTGGIQMSANEKDDIIAFLKTLTDKKFTTDARFSEPVK